jgi:arginase
MSDVKARANRHPGGAVTMQGFPCDIHSSFLRGAALAPARIREALFCGSANLCCEGGLDLESDKRFSDGGDLDLAGLCEETLFDAIYREAASLVGGGRRLLALGGDHFITWPIVKAHASAYGPLDILHLDAHSDLYDRFEGSRWSHASPFARIMEAGMAARLVQVGIRTLTPHLRKQAQRFGVEIIEMKDCASLPTLTFDNPVYLSLDLDVLDPAFAPGVSHHEPGGFTTRELISLIQTLPARLAGADIVEYNPVRDPVGLTAATAAKLAKEIAARMLEQT